MALRKIVHIDMGASYAYVEQRDKKGSTMPEADLQYRSSAKPIP